MKKLILLAVLLSGCANMTEREKQTAWIVSGIVVTGIIISSSSGSNSTTPSCIESIRVGPDGSDRICK